MTVTWQFQHWDVQGGNMSNLIKHLAHRIHLKAEGCTVTHLASSAEAPQVVAALGRALPDFCNDAMCVVSTWTPMKVNRPSRYASTNTSTAFPWENTGTAKWFWICGERSPPHWKNIYIDFLSEGVEEYEGSLWASGSTRWLLAYSQNVFFCMLRRCFT